MTDANHERAKAALPDYPGTFDERETEGTIIGRLDKIVALHTNNLAIDDGRRELTYGELATRVRRFAGGLAARGV